MKNELYYKFERELGRLLSPMETEIIDKWNDSYENSIIIEALKESVYRGVISLKYINKILENWNASKTSDEEVKIADEDISWLN